MSDIYDQFAQANRTGDGDYWRNQWEAAQAEVERLREQSDDQLRAEKELAEEIERLRDERDLLRNELYEERGLREMEHREVERLRARVEELEEVLLALCQTPCPNMYDERWARADDVLKKVGK